MIEELVDNPTDQLEGSVNLPRYPASWYFLCRSKELPTTNSAPKRIDVAGMELVLFRSSSGIPVALNARCCHFGSDLGRGRVIDGCIECPLHGWRFNAVGRCNFIPSGDTIPPWAKQRSYPVVERFGQLFVFRGSKARFPFPFFLEATEEELYASSPFTLHESCPWYMVGVNGFDLQHYRMAHGRTLVANPTTTSPSDFARRIEMTLEVTGTKPFDHIARLVAGKQLKFSVTAWAGNLLFVSAKFEHAATYGLVSVTPLSTNSCAIHSTVFIQRKPSSSPVHFRDRINAALRREFIRWFLLADQGKLSGTKLVPARCISTDDEAFKYIKWLEQVSARGMNLNEEPKVAVCSA